MDCEYIANAVRRGLGYDGWGYGDVDTSRCTVYI
jgi:hypothetical protein